MGLASEAIPNTKIRIVGGGIFLTGKYDENQLWFSFMSNAVFEVRRDTTPAPPAPPAPPAKANGRFVEIDPSYRQLYPTDVIYKDQYILPFPESRQVSVKGFKKIKNSKNTCWERDADGDLIQLHFYDNKNYTREDVINWCNETLKGQFNLRYSFRGDIHLTFEKMEDAILAKLKFS